MFFYLGEDRSAASVTEMPCQLQTVIPEQCVPELCVLGVRWPTSNSAHPVFILPFVSLKKPVGEGTLLLLNCPYLHYWKYLTIHLPTECCPCEVNRRGSSQLCYAALNAINSVNAMCKLGKCPQDACNSVVVFSFWLKAHLEQFLPFSVLSSFSKSKECCRWCPALPFTGRSLC